MTVFFLLSALLLSPASWAVGGDWVGNGGDLIRCWRPAEHKFDYELLDYYEGRFFRGLQLDLGPNNASFDDKVHYALQRLAKKNPTRAALYGSWYKTFFTDTRFFMDGRILQIPDTGPLVIPEGCTVQQIAAQLPDDQILPGDYRYTIDLDLWNDISEDTRAGLILHELVYREAIGNHQTNSKRVRYFNQYISASAFENFGDAELLGLVRTAGFRSVDYAGIPLDLSYASFYQDGKVQKAYATGGQWRSASGAMVPLAHKWIVFDENGAVLRVEDLPVSYGADPAPR
jgi:hypothetical protein